MIRQAYIFGVVLSVCAYALSAQAAFTFAPPRTPEPLSQTSAVDSNTTTEFSVIDTLEKKITTGFSPWIMEHARSVDAIRQELAKKYQANLTSTAPKSFNYYLYTVLEFIFSNGYALYGLSAAVILFVIRTILARLNFIA